MLCWFDLSCLWSSSQLISVLWTVSSPSITNTILNVPQLCHFLQLLSFVSHLFCRVLLYRIRHCAVRYTQLHLYGSRLCVTPAQVCVTDCCPHGRCRHWTQKCCTVLIEPWLWNVTLRSKFSSLKGTVLWFYRYCLSSVWQKNMLKWNYKQTFSFG